MFLSFILLRISCGSGQQTQVIYNGRQVIVKGGTPHSTIQDSNTLTIKVDSHNITLGENQLTINGVAKQLADFQKIVITVDEGKIEYQLDDKISPAKNSKKDKMPQGFVKVKGDIESGQILHKKFENSKSSTDQLEQTLNSLSSYFDKPLTSIQGFRDKNDRQ